MASGASMVCDRFRRHPVKYAMTGLALVVVALVSIFMVASCTYFGGPVSGRVLDSETGNPIAGAVVVARWDGSVNAIVDSRNVCFHVETAISDAAGKYHMPLWWQRPESGLLIGYIGPRVDAYRLGYEGTYLHTKEAAEHPQDVYMKKYASSDEERFEFIGRRIFSGMSCLGAGPSTRNLFPLYVAAIREAKALAKSPREVEEVEGMRKIAATDWLAAPGDSPVDRFPQSKLPPDVIERA